MKMVPLNSELHGSLKLSPAGDIGFAKSAHFAQVVVPEFGVAAPVFPIVFVENGGTKEFEPVVMLGFEPGQNLAINDEGQWGAPFVPATIRQYPFGYSLMEEQPDKWILVFDEESDILTEGEGEPLFKEDGEPADVLNTVMQFIGELQGSAVATQEFCRYMKEKDLLGTLDLRIPRGDTVLGVNDVYAVDEKRFNELPDETFIELKNRGYLPLVYAHLLSLSQIDRLVALDNEASASSGMRKPAEGAGVVN